MNRDEHLTWARQRALEYVGLGQMENALASMTSDAMKHPDTRTMCTTERLHAGHLAVVERDLDALRAWIEGWT
jgi:hypothetical protein